MGHIGKEIILCPVCFFRHLLGSAQFLTLLCFFLRSKQVNKTDSEKHQQESEYPDNQYKNIGNTFCNYIFGHIANHIKF